MPGFLFTARPPGALALENNSGFKPLWVCVRLFFSLPAYVPLWFMNNSCFKILRVDSGTGGGT